MKIELDNIQKKAVEYNRGNLLVIAGPGAGKTRVIVSRIQHLIENGVKPDRILAVTFTNKAADEIRERINKSLGDIESEPVVSTFHSFALRIIREFHETAGLDKFFTVIDDSAQDEILIKSLRDHNIAPTIVVLRRLRSHMDFEKAKAGFPLMHPSMKKELREDIKDVFKEYQQFLAANNALDFNDLILFGLMILQGDEEARTKFRNRFDHILLDEFQDINLSQYELTRLIVRDDATVLAVADADQMIYNWRGSDPALLSSFLRDYKAERIELTTNYRSANEIVLATKTLISHNRLENKTEQKIPDDIEPRVAFLEISDDKNTAKTISKIVTTNISRGFSPSDIAIVYRIHGFGDNIEKELLNNDIPVQRVSPNDDIVREGIDQLMCYLKLSQNLFDWDVKSAWDFPRRILNPLEGYRVTERARTLGISLFKLVCDSDQKSTVSPLTQKRLERFSKLVEQLTSLSVEYSPSGYFKRLRKELGSFLSPFSPAEETSLVETLSLMTGDWDKLIDILSDSDIKPHVLILHPGGVTLQLASLMIALTLKSHLGISSQISLSENISDNTWKVLSKKISQDNQLVVINLGSASKTDSYLEEFWKRGFSFEMFEIKPPIHGEQFLIAQACFRFLIDLLTRMPSSENERLVVYDLETTGIDTRRCEIIELSALSTQLHSGNFETYNALVKPNKSPPPEITELTGITPEMLKDAIDPKRVISEFNAFSHGAVLIGHNILGFDNRIMERYYPNFLGQEFIVDSIDTVKWARELFPNKSNKLEALGKRFHLTMGSLHRAGEDVRLNLEVFNKLLETDGIKRGLDFSSEAVIIMALITLQRDEPERDIGKAFLNAAIRLVANDEACLKTVDFGLEKSFTKSAFKEMQDTISSFKKEKYPEDPQRKRWNNLADHLGDMIMRFEERGLDTGIYGFLNHYALMTESDRLMDGNSVRMMSIHAAKGLEFPIVIIVGLEQGSIPHYLALENLERIEEERRLLYVAMTRAKEKVYLVYTPKRGGRFRMPSMFMQEIPDKLCKRYRFQ